MLDEVNGRRYLSGPFCTTHPRFNTARMSAYAAAFACPCPALVSRTATFALRLETSRTPSNVMTRRSLTGDPLSTASHA
jgi:hypothetical protein